jgi:hypothetical protein
MKDNFDAQMARVAKIFKKKEAPEMNTESLGAYKAFLEKNLSLPVRVRGIEDFDWEEFYVLGPGDKDEYEEMKKTRPSYTDTFEILGFDDYVDDMRGIFVKVKRISDKKKFVLPLADVEGIEKRSESASLLHDYAVWQVNY